VKNIRNEASSCPGIFSRTLRFYYVASSPGFPLSLAPPVLSLHLLGGHRGLVKGERERDGEGEMKRDIPCEKVKDGLREKEWEREVIMIHFSF